MRVPFQGPSRCRPTNQRPENGEYKAGVEDGRLAMCPFGEPRERERHGHVAWACPLASDRTIIAGVNVGFGGMRELRVARETCIGI